MENISMVKALSLQEGSASFLTWLKLHRAASGGGCSHPLHLGCYLSHCQQISPAFAKVNHLSHYNP